MSTPQNYMLHVKCPYCAKPLLVTISGFGSELASRAKVCKSCNKTFTVHLHACTSVEPTINDGEISEIKLRIKYLQQQRKQTKAELLLRYEVARKLYDESLHEARKMREHASEN